jgi:hypothetical protein
MHSIIKLIAEVDPSLSWKDVLQLLGVPGFILFGIIYAIWKGWLVPGWVYTDAVTKRNELQTELDKLDGEARDDAKKYLNTILEQRSLIERSASAVERVAQKIGDAK